MSWYRSGTITVTNGSTAVAGVGTTWNGNVAVGEALLGPDGRVYEITAIGSNTALTLGSAYLGSTASGQAYVIAPTQAYVRDLAAAAAALVTSYSTSLATVVAGRFGDGAAATPGITFNNDQDTGLFRSAANKISIVTGGVERVTVEGTGYMGLGTASPLRTFHIKATEPGILLDETDAPTANRLWRLMGSGGTLTVDAAADDLASASSAYVITRSGVGAATHSWLTAGVERLKINTLGDLEVKGTINVLGTGLDRLMVSALATSTGARLTAVNAANSAYSPLTLEGSSLILKYAGAVGATLTGAGALLIGTTTPLGSAKLVVNGGINGGLMMVGTLTGVANAGTDQGVIAYTTGLHASRDSGPAAYFRRTTNDGQLMGFNRDTTLVGSISVTTTATAYNTSSDYRLKASPQPLTGSGAFIDALQPKTWTWVSNGEPGVGFLAHEAQLVSPGSVVGVKDAVNADGSPDYQAMEYGSAEFIANIVAEIQSLRVRTAALEAA